ncbi:MAG: dethiobiotin synthase [Epsilonproteobacteria bacterium]|nr:dethiobiotin synthase [Campylobacterota bacterium]
MAKNIFITATNTDVGKTFATLQLIKEFHKKGLKVGVFKPIETGVEKTPKDAKILYETSSIYNHNLKKISIDKIAPYRFPLPAAPYVAKGKGKIDLNEILNAYDQIAQISDIVLIEGAGGLMVPIEKNLFMIDLIEIFNAKTLLVTPDRLGCINDTLLSINILKSRKKEFVWCINLRDEEDFRKKSLPFYKDYFGRLLYLQYDIDKIASLLISDSNGNGNSS